MTALQVTLLRCGQRRARARSLIGSARPVLQRRHCQFEVSRRPSNSKVIRAQVLLLLLIEYCLHLHGIAFVIMAQVGRRQIVLLDFIVVSGLMSPNIEVARLDRVDEVCVRWHNRFVRILGRVDPGISGGEAVFHAPSKLYRAPLGGDVTLFCSLGAPSTSLPSDRVVDSPVLQVLRHSSTNAEVCRLILNCRVLLPLPSASFSSSSQLLVLGLRVVDSWVLAKDEVRASEFINLGPSLLLRIVRSLLLIARINLLLDSDVRHICFCTFR